MTTPSPARPEVTQLPAGWRCGDDVALDNLIPLVKPELRRLARHYYSALREEAGQ